MLWDRTYGFSSLSEKTRKSNHLQMLLQRQHFLLSYMYLKILSVGQTGVWTRSLLLSRPMLSQLSCTRRPFHVPQTWATGMHLLITAQTEWECWSANPTYLKSSNYLIYKWNKFLNISCLWEEQSHMASYHIDLQQYRSFQFFQLLTWTSNGKICPPTTLIGIETGVT